MSVRNGIADGKDANGLGLPQAMYGLASPVQPERESPDERATRNFYGEPPRGQSDSTEDAAQKWLRERMHLLTVSRRFAQAVELIEKSLKDPLPERVLSICLTFLAVLAMARRSLRRKAWETLWSAGTGKTWKAVTEFPERLRRMADEVERLNASQFFAPAQYVNVDSSEAEIARRRFYLLPGVLRVYSAALEAHIERVPRLKAQVFPSRPPGHPEALFDLSKLVKALTGRYHDKEVVELLNAAALALGEKAEFDALSIAQARSRRQKKAKT